MQVKSRLQLPNKCIKYKIKGQISINTNKMAIQKKMKFKKNKYLHKKTNS